MMKDHTGKCCSVHCVAYALVLVGALNWGLVAIGHWMGGSNWNLVNLLLGNWPVLENIVYLLVGLSALAMLCKKSCAACKK